LCNIIIATCLILFRYVLYDVNKPEGFNLRRDVFIRMASFIHHMNKVSDYQWILVNIFYFNSYRYNYILLTCFCRCCHHGIACIIGDHQILCRTVFHGVYSLTWIPLKKVLQLSNYMNFSKVYYIFKYFIIRVWDF